MHHRFRANALVAVLLLLPAVMAGAQQASQAPAQSVTVSAPRAVSSWYRAETRHFSVYSDAPEEEVIELLVNLEKLDQLLRIYTVPVRQQTAAGAGAPERMTLYFLGNLSDLSQIDEDRPAHVAGLYSSCHAGAAGFGAEFDPIVHLGDAQLDRARLNDTLYYVFEAYARHFLYRHTDLRTPASFVEGLAQYFAAVRFSDHQMVVGRVPQTLGRYFGFLADGARYSLDYTDVLDHRLHDGRNYGGADGERLEFEAKSWLLTHYMLSTDDRRQRLNRYLALVDQGQTPTTAFAQAYGVKASDIDELMWRYRLHGLAAPRVEFPTPPTDAGVVLHSLPEGSGPFVVADAALKSCPGPRQGQALLKKLGDEAGRVPDNLYARLAWGRALVDWGQAEEALPVLDAAVRADGANFEARYLLGMAHLRLAQQGEGETRRAHAQAALHALQGALSLEPRSPDAALAAFKAGLATGDDPAQPALQAVVSAWQSARDGDQLARFAALAQAYRGDAAAAKQVLVSLQENSLDPAMASWAKQWDGRVDAGLARSDILAEMRRPSAPTGSFKEWTLDKEAVLRLVKRNYGLQSVESALQSSTPGQNGSTGPSGGASMTGSPGTSN